jgi:hypothetical protein
MGVPVMDDKGNDKLNPFESLTVDKPSVSKDLPMKAGEESPIAEDELVIMPLPEEKFELADTDNSPEKTEKHGFSGSIFKRARGYIKNRYMKWRIGFSAKSGKEIDATARISGNDIIDDIWLAYDELIAYIKRNREKYGWVLLKRADEFFTEIIKDIEFNANRLSGVSATLKQDVADAVSGLRRSDNINISGLMGALADLVNKRIAQADLPTSTLGMIFLINALKETISSIDGANQADLLELMRLCTFQKLVNYENASDFANMKSGLDELASLFMMKTHEKHALVDLAPFKGALMKDFDGIIDYALNKFSDGLGEVFRDLIGLNTLDQIAGLVSSRMSTEDLFDLASALRSTAFEIALPYDTDQRGRFASYNEWFAWAIEGRRTPKTVENKIYAWRQQIISRMVWYQYYNFLKSHLKLGIAGKLQFIRLISEQDGNIKSTLINLVNLPTSFNWKDHGAIGEMWAAQKLFDGTFELFTLAVTEASLYAKRGFTHGKVGIKQVITAKQRELYKNNANWKDNVALWKWGQSKANPGAMDNVALWREVLGTESLGIMRIGKNRVMDMLPAQKTKNPNKGAPQKILNFPVERAEKPGKYFFKAVGVQRAFDPIILQQIGIIWAESKILGMKRKVWTNVTDAVHMAPDLTIRVGLDTLGDSIENFSRDWNISKFDDMDVRVGNYVTDRLYYLTKNLSPPVSNSIMTKLRSSFSWIWDKLLAGRIQDQREAYIQHLMELIWKHGLENAIQYSSYTSIRNTVSLVTDAHGSGKNWKYIADLSLEDAYEIVNSQSKIDNWVLDGLKSYYNTATGELAIFAINSKVLDTFFEVDKRLVHIEKDIRNLSLFLQGLFNLMRADTSLRDLDDAQLAAISARWGGSQGIFYRLTKTAKDRLIDLGETIQGKISIEGGEVKSVSTYAVMRIAGINYTVKDKAKTLTDMFLHIVIWEPPAARLGNAITALKHSKSRNFNLNLAGNAPIAMRLAN